MADDSDYAYHAPENPLAYAPIRGQPRGPYRDQTGHGAIYSPLKDDPAGSTEPESTSGLTS